MGQGGGQENFTRRRNPQANGARGGRGGSPISLNLNRNGLPHIRDSFAPNAPTSTLLILTRETLRPGVLLALNALRWFVLDPLVVLKRPALALILGRVLPPQHWPGRSWPPQAPPRLQLP